MELKNRIRLAYNWIPKGANSLLDAGCYDGASTKAFQNKVANVCGLDPIDTGIKEAKKNYPEINFLESELKDTPFENNDFDVVILCDVFEHVDDEIGCLNEIYRILKQDGVLIITTPHAGLFGFMDPGNSIRYIDYFVKRYLSFVFKCVYKVKHGVFPDKVNYEKPVYAHNNSDVNYTHRHYSLGKFIKIFNSSDFNGHYEISNVARVGLFLQPLFLNARFYLDLFKVPNAIKYIILTPLDILSEIDYYIPYGQLAYNIGLRIVKK